MFKMLKGDIRTVLTVVSMCFVFCYNNFAEEEVECRTVKIEE